MAAKRPGLVVLAVVALIGAPLTAVAAAGAKIASDSTAMHSRRAVAPDLGVVAPAVAAAGLPIFLTGSGLQLDALRAVRFTSGRRVRQVGRHAVAQSHPGTQVRLAVPPLRPGRYEVTVRTRHGWSDPVTLRVVRATSFRPGRPCPAQWLDLSAGHLLCSTQGGALRWRPLTPAPRRSPGVVVPAAATTTGPPAGTGGRSSSSPATSTSTTSTSTTSTSTSPEMSLAVSESGDPSRGSASATLTAVVSAGTSPNSPAAGSLSFTLASASPYQTSGTLQLTTLANGQRSCTVEFRNVYVEQEDPSALGAPDGWRGEVVAAGDCRASGSGALPAGQPFLDGITATAAYAGPPVTVSTPDTVDFTGGIDVAGEIVASAGAACGAAPQCVQVWASSPDYVGEVTAGTLTVSSAGPAGLCHPAVLYDSTLPGVAATPPASVVVPRGCDALTSRYTAPAAPVTGAGNEPISYQSSVASTAAFAALSTVELATAATFSYPPVVP